VYLNFWEFSALRRNSTSFSTESVWAEAARHTAKTAARRRVPIVTIFARGRSRQPCAKPPQSDFQASPDGLWAMLSACDLRYFSRLLLPWAPPRRLAMK